MSELSTAQQTSLDEFLEWQARERAEGFTNANLARTMGVLSDRMTKHELECQEYRKQNDAKHTSIHYRIQNLEVARERSIRDAMADAERQAQNEAARAPSVPPPRPKLDSYPDDSEENARKAGVAVAASPKVHASPEEVAAMVQPMIEAATAKIKIEADRRTEEAFRDSELARLKAIDDATKASDADKKRIKDAADANARRNSQRWIAALVAIVTAAGLGVVSVATSYASKVAEAKSAAHAEGALEERANSRQQVAAMARAVDVAASAVAAVTAEPTPVAPPVAPANAARKSH